ncbi:MAG: response regulator [Balneolaceae bacterium]
MGKVKALIVDDSKIMRSAVKRALNQLMLADFEFVEAKNGVEALQQFNNNEIQIVFVDWNMPSMSGLEFAMEVRKLRSSSDVPIVMVTSEKSMDKIDKALSNGGVNEYVTKPYTADKMSKAIGKYFTDEGEISSEAMKAGQNGSKGFFKKILNS